MSVDRKNDDGAR